MKKTEKPVTEKPAVDSVAMFQLEVCLYPVVTSNGYLDINDHDKAVTFKENRDGIVEVMASVHYWLSADKETDDYDTVKNWIRIGRKMFDPSNYRMVEFNVYSVEVSENKVIASTPYNAFEMDQICEEAYNYYVNGYSPYPVVDDEDDDEEGDGCPWPDWERSNA